MDALIAAGFHNQTCSPLHQLPMELLLAIMELLDPTGIMCLRRISRILLRICSSSFKRYHDTGPLPVYYASQGKERGKYYLVLSVARDSRNHINVGMSGPDTCVCQHLISTGG